MEDERREILSQVAQGILSPPEAAARLEELERAPVATREPVPSASAQTAIRTVKVVGIAGHVVVQGDSSVREAVADGPHRVTLEGETMVISLERPDDSGFFFSRKLPARFPIGIGEAGKLNVRVNPDLALVLESQAASLRCSGVRGPITATIQAGSTSIEGCEGPLQVTAQASSVRIRGRVTTGESTIRCEMGTVQIDLLKGSSVRIKAAATMGKVSIDGTQPTDVWGQTSREVVVGGGAARLGIESTMSSVRVATEV